MAKPVITNPEPDAPDQVAAETEKQPKLHKKWIRKRILPLIVLLIIGVGGAIYAATGGQTSTNNPTSTDKRPVNNQLGFVPRLDSVSAYAPYKDADWYGASDSVLRVGADNKVSYYTNRDGIPFGSVTGLISYKGRLWLSAQVGTAVFDDKHDKFVEVQINGKTSDNPKAEPNQQLYYDKYSDKLYLSAFENIFVYNDQSNAWIKFDQSNQVPEDISFFAASKDYLATSNLRDGGPVYVYSKHNNSWKKLLPANLGGNMAEVFTLNNQIFAIGQAKHQDGCVVGGASDSVSKLDANGTWVSIGKLNLKNDFVELATHIKDPTISAVNFGCGDKPQNRYDLMYANGKVSAKLVKRNVPQSGFAGDDGEQHGLVRYLNKVTGLPAYVQLQAFDKNSNAVFSYTTTDQSGSNPSTDKIAVANGVDFTNYKSLTIPKQFKYDAISPIMCDGLLQYIFIGGQAATVNAYEGFPNGNWATAKLLRVDGSQAKLFANLGNRISEPRFACGGGKLTWLGRRQFTQMDLGTKKITTFGPISPDDNTSLQIGTVYPLGNGDLWATVPNNHNGGSLSKTGSLFIADASARKAKKLVSTTNTSLMAGATDRYAWLVSNAKHYPNVVLTAYDRKGNKQTSITSTDPQRLIAYDSNRVVVLSGLRGDYTFYPFEAKSGSVTTQLTKLSMDLPFKQLDSATSAGGGFGYGSSLSYWAVEDPVRHQAWIANDNSGPFVINLP